jgi:predicted transcriptional regulator
MHLDLYKAPQETTVIRMERVHSILAKKGGAAWALSPDDTVFDAIAMMNDRGVGALLVMAAGALVGVISERDYARKVFLQGRSSKETAVREIMSSPVITVSPDHRVDDCLRIMTEHHIRHLPVLDGGKLAGVVSIGDLVSSIIASQAETIEHLSAYITGGYTAV